MDNTKETVSPRHNRIDAHWNAQRLWKYAQGLHRSKIGFSTKRKKWSWCPILNQETVSSWQLLAKEKLVLSNGVHWIIKYPQGETPCPAVKGQHKTKSLVLLENFLFHVALFRYRYFTGLLPVYYVSYFVLLWFFFSCVCVPCVTLLFIYLLFIYIFFACLFSKEKERRCSVG